MIEYEKEYSRLLNLIYTGSPGKYPKELPIELRAAYDAYWTARQSIDKMTFTMYRNVEKAVGEYLLKQ